MAVVKEWACLEHGEFTGTHPICPNFGCESASVVQEFRTPVGIGSEFRKRFDAGIRKSSEMMGIDDFKSAREGETSFAGRADPKTGTKVLWGDESKKVLGKNFAELTAVAQKPLEVTARTGEVLKLERNNGMREAATESGITRRRLPKAHEVSAERSPAARAQAEALTT